METLAVSIVKSNIPDCHMILSNLLVLNWDGNSLIFKTFTGGNFLTIYFNPLHFLAFKIQKQIIALLTQIEENLCLTMESLSTLQQTDSKLVTHLAHQCSSLYCFFSI